MWPSALAWKQRISTRTEELQLESWRDGTRASWYGDQVLITYSGIPKRRTPFLVFIRPFHGYLKEAVGYMGASDHWGCHWATSSVMNCSFLKLRAVHPESSI